MNNYFIRIDDLRLGMNKNILKNILVFFKRINIKPLIAVISKGPKDLNFWKTIKELQDNGWIIGLHGYNHNPRKILTELSQ